MKKILIKLVIIFGLITVLTGLSNVLVDNAQGVAEKEDVLEPGDIAFFDRNPDEAPNKGGHVMMYAGESGDRHYFIQSGIPFLTVCKLSVEALKIFGHVWEDEYYYVLDNTGTALSANEKLPTAEWACKRSGQGFQRIGHYYQIDERGRGEYGANICHWRLDDQLDITGEWFEEDNIKEEQFPGQQFAYIWMTIHTVPQYVCAELPWAAYMNLENIEGGQINIGNSHTWQRSESKGLGDDCWMNVAPPNLRKSINTQNFTPKKSPFLKNYVNMAKGFVNGNLNEDDPNNCTWTTIQKGIDNLSTLEIL